MDHLTKAIHTEDGTPDSGLERALRMERSIEGMVNMFLIELVLTYVHM